MSQDSQRSALFDASVRMENQEAAKLLRGFLCHASEKDIQAIAGALVPPPGSDAVSPMFLSVAEMERRGLKFIPGYEVFGREHWTWDEARRGWWRS